MVVKTNVAPRVSPSQIDTLMAIEASVYQVSSKGFSNMLEYDLLFLILLSPDKNYNCIVKTYEVPYLYKHKKSYKNFIDSNLTPTASKWCKTSKEASDFINDKLLHYWANSDVFKIKLRITPYLANENDVYETIYVKKGRFTHTGMMGAVRHDYARHGELKSNVMKQKNKSPTKKNNNLTKSCKRMTGDIGQLGKNFKRLI